MFHLKLSTAVEIFGMLLVLIGLGCSSQSSTSSDLGSVATSAPVRSEVPAADLVSSPITFAGTASENGKTINVVVVIRKDASGNLVADVDNNGAKYARALSYQAPTADSTGRNEASSGASAPKHGYEQCYRLRGAGRQLCLMMFYDLDVMPAE